jgi:hypothetical protein
MVSKKYSNTLAFLLILVIFVAGDARADTPLEPVYNAAFCSKNQTYCARSTAVPAHLEVYERAVPGNVLWSREEFVAKGFLSDDGKAVVSCYPGLNLLPTDATLDFLLVRILRASGKVDEIKLRNLFSSVDELPHSTSHLVWGRCVGIEDGKVVLERADGSRWMSDSL